MDTGSIYKDIATRTQGDIYIGVVGPVRTGKSTFIKKFMDNLVIPNIEAEKRDRAVDELPQSAAGRTIMTTEPKFVPESGVKITLDGNAQANIRLIDCVGYIVPSALGYIENDAPRMVKTPWSETEMPFNEAAEIGTRRVITEHSTIGLVVTTDGSISDIPREEYEAAEERVVNELKAINKPFAVLLNCTEPQSESVQNMSRRLMQKYDAPVIGLNCLEITEKQIRSILMQVLFEFPIKEIMIDLPKWICSLEKGHWLRSSVLESIRAGGEGIAKMRQADALCRAAEQNEYISRAEIASYDLGSGSCRAKISIGEGLFYRIISESCDMDICNDGQLMQSIVELSQTKKEYDKIKAALAETQATGYGIVVPSFDDMQLSRPETVRQSGRYGVKIKASASAIHMMRADISAEVTPIIGEQAQADEFLQTLVSDYENDPQKLWDTNLLGRSLRDSMNDSLNNKLYRIPEDARQKLRETVERITNEGCTGLICLIL